MNLERQGNHYPDSIDIFSVGGCKVNIIDTPRPYGFFVEVYRSLSVLDERYY